MIEFIRTAKTLGFVSGGIPRASMIRIAKDAPTGNVAATMWEIDLSDGSIVWSADRGANSLALFVADEGGTTVVYECGNYIDATEKSLTKWTDNGSSATKDWTAANGTINYKDVMKSDDGYVWAHGTKNVRYNDSGTEQHNVTSINAGHLTDAGSGSIAEWGPGAGQDAKIYDNTATNTHTLTVASTDTLLPMGTRRSGALNGWCESEKKFSPSVSFDLVRYNTTFTEQDRYIGSTSSRDPAVANDAYCIAEDAGDMDSHDMSDMSVSWSSTAFSMSPPHTTTAWYAIFDASDNLLVASVDGSSVWGVRKFNSSGAEQWDTACSNRGYIIDHYATGSQVIGCVVGGQETTIDGETGQIFALDDSDGSLDWMMSFAGSVTNIAGWNAAQIFGGYIYVCGNRYVP